MRTREYVTGVALALLLTACGGTPATRPESTPSASASATSTGGKAALDPGAGVPKVGDCYRMTASQMRASVAAPAKVGCDGPHTSVVAFVGYVATPVSPLTSIAQRRALGRKVCEPAYRQLAGGTLADRAQSLLTWTLFTPGQRQLERGARWVRCDVYAQSGDDLVPLPAAQPLLQSGVPDSLRVCQDAKGVDVSCARQSVFRVTAVFRAPGKTYPGVTATDARSRCQELTGVIGGYFQPPSKAGWETGDRFVRCLIKPQATNPTISPTPSP